MPTFIFNKLIRDKLPDEFVRMNQTAVYRQLSGSALSKELVNKIIEEAKEIHTESTKQEIIVELADVRQAMEDLMKLHAITESEIIESQKKKFEKKGGFSEGHFVVSLELKDDDEWVDYYRTQPTIFTEIGAEKIVNEKELLVPLIEAGVYEHYKGKRYEVIGVGLDSETMKPVVVYVPLDKTTVPVWVRPYEMFLEFITVDGKKLRRFKKIDA